MDDARAQFETLLDGYYESWFRFHPETAVDLGVSGFEGVLRPCDDDDVGALLVLQEKLLNSLEDIDVEALDPDRQIDLVLLAGQANIEHHELLEHDWRRRDPQQFIPVYAIYQLTVKPVRGDEDIQALSDAVHANQPRSDSLLQTCRKQIQAARAFVLEHELVSVPAAEKLHVVETPEFLRHQIPFAAYLSPVRVSRYFMTGFYPQGRYRYPWLSGMCLATITGGRQSARFF